MSPAWQAAVVLVWLATVLLAFGYAALLRDLRELRAGVGSGDVDAGLPAVVAPALATPNPAGTIALAVDPACGSCGAATTALARHAGRAGPDLRVVAADDEVAGWPDAASVGVVVDPVLWDALRVQTTPMLLRFDPDGALRERRVVGSAQHLDELVAAVAAGSGRAAPAPTNDGGAP